MTTVREQGKARRKDAIIQAAKNGVTIDGGTVYVTASPCWNRSML